MPKMNNDYLRSQITVLRDQIDALKHMVETIPSTTYQKEALRTEACNVDKIRSRINSQQIIRSIHAGVGLATETGEIQDTIKKHLFYEQPLDVENLLEEAGDILWYAALLIDACNSNLDDVMQQNIEKLRKRYPEKFSSALAKERRDKNTEDA